MNHHRPAVQESNPASKPSERPDLQLFDSIAAFISRYLACDQHQLTILTLWVAHTWCPRSSPTAAYLNICSAEPQSGKSTCLMLLSRLAHNSFFATGCSAAVLIKHLLVDAHRRDVNKFHSTIFLDECHHTFGPSERQPLLALLNSGSDAAPCYLAASNAYSFFGPKAFAANTPLPTSLAQRCLPINLRRRKRSDKLSRLHSGCDESANLTDQLMLWASHNSEALAQAAQKEPPRLPDGLIPREQACAEPLIHIADRLGGSWPDRARAAVKEIFRKTEGTNSTELLCDLRVLFFNRKDPEYLPTKDILEALRQLEYRPWAAWSRNSGKRLGAILHRYGIHPQVMHHKSSPDSRGYYFKHFQDAWERYVPPIPANIANVTENTSVTVTKNLSQPDKPNGSNQLYGKTESGPISYPYGT